METSTFAKICIAILALFQSYFRWTPLNLYEFAGLGLDTLQPHHHLAGLIICNGEGGDRDSSRPWNIRAKNMIQLDGIPFVAWAVNAMVNSQVFTTMWVSTDDQETADYIMNTYGGRVRIFHRPINLEPVRDPLLYVQEFLTIHPEVDAIGAIKSTNPYVKIQDIRHARDLLRKFDSIFSAISITKGRWKALFRTQDESTVRLNFDPSEPPGYQMVENGDFYFSMRNVIMKGNKFQGKRPTYIHVPRRNSLEIDYMLQSDRPEAMTEWASKPFQKMKELEEQKELEEKEAKAQKVLEISENKHDDNLQQKISLPDETRTEF